MAPLASTPVPAPVAAPPATASVEAPRFRPIEIEFLNAFVTPIEAKSMLDLNADDRMFVGGIRQRWHQRDLDLPVLPQTALRLRELLQKGDVSIPRYAELVERDSALAVEVLKAANSAQLGAASAITSTTDAIARIGLQRLETILLLAQLKKKVLKGGPLQAFGELLVSLSMPLGQAAARLADEQHENPNVAFTRGTLLHIEHFVILGALPDLSYQHKRTLTPSVAALHQVFAEYGPEIREVVARNWGLEPLLVGGTAAAAVAEHFAALRSALICTWLGQPLPTVATVEPERLEAVLTQTGSRAA